MEFKRYSKDDVKSKKSVTDDKGRKLGTEVEFKDNTKKTLLNPSGKGKKYSRELKEGVHLTNDMSTVKRDDKGNSKRLTDVQRSYRSGYLQAMEDAAAAYNAQNKGDKK